jgi:23S rRNA (guanosine2251-2'-O)-methyltransferase
VEHRRRVGGRKPPHGSRSGPGGERSRPAFDFDDVIYGIHSIEEALLAGERLRAIHVADDRKKDTVLRVLLARAKELDVPVRFEQRPFFAKLPFKTHQGVVAIAPPFEYAALHDIIGGRRIGKHRLFVVLDHLTDPHNVGAIVRTAETAGADGMILPDRRSAGINATVRKSAAGAAAHLPIARVGNVTDSIRTLKKSGVWVAGADASEAAVAMTQADFDRDLAIVIGAEGEGLSQLVKRECDYLVKIPMLGEIASLNASVAAGVLIYEALRQRGT